MFSSASRLGGRLTVRRSAQQAFRSPKQARRQEDERNKSRFTCFGIALGCIGGSWAAAEHRSAAHETATTPARSSYKYLICGGGVAAREALKVFIEENAAGDLLLISRDWAQYGKEPSEAQKGENGLTPQLGIVSRVVEGIGSVIPFLASAPFAEQKPEIVIGRRVKTIDASKRVALLDDDTEVSFERCLIAVGSSIPDIPVGKVVSSGAENLVSGAQSNSDWNRINSVIQEGFQSSTDSLEPRAHLTVVGGGWLSTAVGAELINRGADVTFSHAEPAFLARYFPKYVAQDVLARLLWASEGGVDSMSYAAIRYVIAREPLQQSSRPYEAEVHVGTVFDSFSIVDFRTDHVVFAPTLAPIVPIEVMSANMQEGGFIVNSELAIASDVYAAGASICVGDGAVDYPKVMRWSADHAKATGRHAALNILGAREAYSYKPSLSVNLDPLHLRVHVVGDVDGSSESFGYFFRSRNRGESTCGGHLEKGVLFCVRPAPLSHRGAAQKLLFSGVALWDGSTATQIPNLLAAQDAARELLAKSPMTRPQLEEVMDNYASEHAGITLFTDSPLPEKTSSGTETQSPETKSGGEEDQGKAEGVLEPLVDTRKPSPRVIWRRHRPTRTVRVRADELLWVRDEWEGAVSPDTKEDKLSKAYTEILKRAAQG